MKILEKLAVWSALTLIAGIIGVCIYWQFLQPTDNYITNIENIGSGPILLSKGSTIYIGRSYCIRKEIKPGQATIIRWFTNSTIHSLPVQPFIGTNDIGCETRTFNVHIPDNFSPGEYTYNVRINIQVNPLKQTYVDLPEVRFYVR